MDVVIERFGSLNLSPFPRDYEYVRQTPQAEATAQTQAVFSSG